MKPTTALQRRIAPAVPLALELDEDGGGTRRLDLRLVFDFNAVALVEETLHVNLLAGDVVEHLTGTALSVMFWAALQARQPEYEGAEGLAVVRSWMDLGNAPAISLAVVNAVVRSLPAEQQQAIVSAVPVRERPTAPAPATAEAGNGASSGPSHATTSALPTESSVN
jgi:hypothetical protein